MSLTPYGRTLTVRPEILDPRGLLDMVDLGAVSGRTPRGVAARTPGMETLRDPGAFFDITFPSAEIVGTLRTLGRRAVAPESVPGTILLSGRYGHGKSHVLLAAHHALTAPEVAQRWADRWSLGELHLPPNPLVVTRSFIQHADEPLWDMLLAALSEGRKPKVGDFPDGQRIESLLGDRPVFVIMDELERWYDAQDDRSKSRNRNFLQALEGPHQKLRPMERRATRGAPAVNWRAGSSLRGSSGSQREGKTNSPSRHSVPRTLSTSSDRLQRFQSARAVRSSTAVVRLEKPPGSGRGPRSQPRRPEVRWTGPTGRCSVYTPPLSGGEVVLAEHARGLEHAVVGEHEGAGARRAEHALPPRARADLPPLPLLADTSAEVHVRDEEGARLRGLRAPGERRSPAEVGPAADPGLPARLLQPEREVGRARHGEVPRIGPPGARAQLDALHQHRRDEVQVEVAVPVHVGDLVDRHALERHADVRAVDRVEATQEVLVGLPVPAVRGEVEPRHGAEKIVRRPAGERFDRGPVERAVARGLGRALRLDDDLLSRRFLGDRLHANSLCGASYERRGARGPVT